MHTLNMVTFSILNLFLKIIIIYYFFFINIIIILEYMSFRMTCLMRAYVLSEVMLCRRKCLVGGHVLVECIFSGWHVTICCALLENISYWMTFYYLVCIIGGHALQLEMSYWSTCFYRWMRTGFTGGYVIKEGMYYMRACLTGGHVL